MTASRIYAVFPLIEGEQDQTIENVLTRISSVRLQLFEPVSERIPPTMMRRYQATPEAKAVKLICDDLAETSDKIRYLGKHIAHNNMPTDISKNYCLCPSSGLTIGECISDLERVQQELFLRAFRKDESSWVFEDKPEKREVLVAYAHLSRDLIFFHLNGRRLIKQNPNGTGEHLYLPVTYEGTRTPAIQAVAELCARRSVLGKQSEIGLHDISLPRWAESYAQISTNLVSVHLEAAINHAEAERLSKFLKQTPKIRDKIDQLRT